VLDETFEINALLETQHGPEESKSVTIELASGTETHSVQLTTDDQGVVVATLDDFTTLLDVAEILGELTITASFSGDDHPMAQPLNSTETNRTVLAGALVDVEVAEVAELTDGQYSIQVGLTTTPTVNDSVLSTTTLEWQRKSTDGSLHDEGTIQSSSLMTLSGAAVDGQLLQISFSQVPEYLFFSQTTAEVSLVSESTTTENNTTTDWTPKQISDVTISCSNIELSFVVESSPMSYECTLVNPNPFSVNVSFDIESVDVVGVSFTINDVVMDENETKVVTITANRDSNVVLTSGGSYSSTVSIYTSWSESQDLISSTASLISWSIGEPVELTDDPIEQPESTSSLQSLLLPVGGGLLSLVVVIFVVSKIITSRSPKEDDDDEDDWYEEAMDMVEPKDNEQPKDEVPMETKSLDDLKSEGKTIGEDAPEERGIDFSLGGATKNEIDEHSDDEETTSETYDAEVEEVSDSDDGISVDEDGTEWYEDELGVWWYREQGWDDWAEWQE
jgi:predicted RNA-binding protein with TRAM domain